MTGAVAPFADVEAVMAADTMKLLANAVASVAGGDFAVIFDAAAVPALAGGFESPVPQFQALDTDLALYAVGEGTPVTVRGKHYTCRNPMADSAGMTVIALEGAP
jgi:hypothetical protein